MKKRRLWAKRYRRGWRQTAYKEVGRRHPNPMRRYCGTCGNSFNITRPQHSHAPAHEDYYGEYCEERNECADCINGYCEWIEANNCKKCMGSKPRSRHGKPRSEYACTCEVFQPLNGGDYERPRDELGDVDEADLVEQFVDE